MIFDKILGHEKQIEALKNAELGQAYLFSGPSGVGKKLVAQACAQKILKLSDTQINHPDLFILSTDETFIKVETIRQLQNFVNLKSFTGSSKVVIIDDAHKMNPQAANSLLKTLEEPPPGCHFFLITASKGAMLSTILSRCQKIGFGALSAEVVKKLEPGAPDWAILLSQGRMDMLTKWTDDSKKDLRKNVLKILRELPFSTTADSFNQLDELSEDREHALFSTLLWNHWLKMSVSHSLGVKVSASDDEKEVFDILSKNIPTSSLIDLSQYVLQLERDINANVNRRLAFENFWLTAKNQLVAQTR